jgi:hypothetical protein
MWRSSAPNQAEQSCRSERWTTASSWSKVRYVGSRLLRLLLACAVTPLLFSGCDNVRFVKVSRAGAVDQSAMAVHFFVDGCAEVNNPAVTESVTEIRVRVDARVDDSNTKACLGGGWIHLQQAIGTRRVVDTRSGSVVPVDFGSQYGDAPGTTASSTTTTTSPKPSVPPTSVAKASGCPSDPPFHANALPTGFDKALKVGRAHQIPWDVTVRYYSGSSPGSFIDIYPSELPAWRPGKVVPLAVLNTTGQFGEVEDGYSVTFALPCGHYTLLSSGLSADDFKAVIAGLTLN